MKLKLCKTCGVPFRIGKDHSWNTDGTITQRRDPDHRMLLFDSEGVDVLFKNIEQLIGMPLEKIVIESKARATCAYISHLMRGFRGTAARMVGLGRIIERVVEQGRVMGYGDIKAVDVRWKDRYISIDIASPYSILLFCGDQKGAAEAIRKTEGTVTYEEVSPDNFHVVAYNAPHAPGLENRLALKQTPRKPGDIELDSCPACGVPSGISSFKWDLEKGTIAHELTGLRYAIFGPGGLQAIFDELESELGESIPDTIVEAQRMHAVNRMRETWREWGASDFRNWLALHGLGNMTSIEAIPGGYTARIENAALPQILVGTSIALFEFIIGSKPTADWSVSEDGDLVMTMRKIQ